ncbi:MAG: AmmeMemoRadiSam system protein B [Desulfuromonadaceae bacterium]|nr:AmmeMemoRadiSam system protein B [Desulfuromonadaceae bacterium]
MRRQPAVAAQFYSGNTVQLRDDLSALIPKKSALKARVKGVISPHAGYVYSGAVAGELYANIDIPGTVLIIGPNHHGVGEPAALYPEGEWLTPLGTTSINVKLNSCLLKHTPYLKSDTAAHKLEHSLEVQLPFIQYLRPDVTISVLCISRGDFSALSAIGQGIASAVNEYADDVLIVASSDMTHYESAAAVRAKDDMALGKILLLDAEGLLEVCNRNNITMCGVAPAVVMIEAAIKLGADHAELLAYSNSGDVAGDYSNVVGYAAVSVS